MKYQLLLLCGLLLTPQLVRSEESAADARLCNQVKYSIANIGRNEDFSITLRCVSGTVELGGSASDSTERWMLQSAAEKVPGVRMVRNNISVMPAPDNKVLVGRVENELSRRDGVSFNGLALTANDGVVSVHGHVPRHQDIDRVLSQTLMVNGVSDAKSDVRID